MFTTNHFIWIAICVVFVLAMVKPFCLAPWGLSPWLVGTIVSYRAGRVNYLRCGDLLNFPARL